MSGEDADVLTRAKRGDRNAFGTLVRKYQKRVYATALQIMGNHHDADDVAQEAFVRAFRFLPKFDERADFFTWLYRITVNTSLNHIRTRKRVRNIADKGSEQVGAEGGRPEALGVHERTPHEWVELSDEYRRVVEGISALSPTLRTTLVLATVHGKAYKEIAELLEIPAGTVAWRVNEARKQLRARLAQELAPEPKFDKETDD